MARNNVASVNWFAGFVSFLKEGGRTFSPLTKLGNISVSFSFAFGFSKRCASLFFSGGFEGRHQPLYRLPWYSLLNNRHKTPQ
jgi:hypothetical protein